MENPAGTSAADCTSKHMLASAGIQSCGKVCLTETETETEVLGALPAAVPSPLLPLFRCICVHSFLMSEWCEVTRRQQSYAKTSQGWRAQSGLRAPEWQCATCKTWLFLSKDTCRCCNRRTTSTSTSGHRLRLGHNRAEVPPEPLRAMENKPKGAAQALALARQDCSGSPGSQASGMAISSSICGASSECHSGEGRMGAEAETETETDTKHRQEAKRPKCQGKN